MLATISCRNMIMEEIECINYTSSSYFLYVITKNTDPYKIKKCVSCKKDISLGEKYFAYPLSLQQICLACARREIPKIIQDLLHDLKKVKQEVPNLP